MKKEAIGLLIAVLLLTVVFSGCFEENNPSEGLKYVNKEFGFGFNPPEGWNSTPIVTNDSIYFHPLDRDPSIASSEPYIALIISKPNVYNENETLYSYGENIIKSSFYSHTYEIPSYNSNTYETSNATVNYTVNNLTGKNATINGNPAYEIFCNSTTAIYTSSMYTSSGYLLNQTYYDMRKIFLIEKNKKFFEIHYVSQPVNDSEESYEYYLPVVTQSINSFTII